MGLIDDSRERERICDLTQSGDFRDCLRVSGNTILRLFEGLTTNCGFWSRNRAIPFAGINDVREVRQSLVIGPYPDQGCDEVGELDLKTKRKRTGTGRSGAD